MIGTRKKRAGQELVRYATGDDFRRIFAEDLNHLYRLAFLLTGDPAKAEQCFVAGFEDSVKNNAVFAEWARSWAKRTIIRNAIQALNPRPGRHDSSPPSTDFVQAGELPREQTRHFVFQAVLALEDFDRFVFILSVLERYSDHDCALLLGCSPAEIEEARTRALRTLTGRREMVFVSELNREELRS